MLFNFFSIKINKNKLFIQLFLIFLFFFLFYIQNLNLAISSIKGGISALLSNFSFGFLINYCIKNMPEKKFPWNFIIAEIINIFLSIILLILALKSSKIFYFPLFLTWLFIKIIQIFIPLIEINKINDKRNIYVYKRDY